MICVEERRIELPEVDTGEVLRYLKAKSFDGLPFRECMAEMGSLSGTVAFAEFDVARDENGLSLGFASTDSKDLAKALGSSEKVLCFAATVGMTPDRLIAKYSRLSPVKAVLFQAIGAERIEALCDAFCKERDGHYRQSGLRLRPRFSPGYGDLPLSLQKELLTALDARKWLGLSLTESLLMMPSKSVTALAGIEQDQRREP